MTEQIFSRVERVPRTGSTNTDLRRAVQAAPARWPHLSVLVAEQQDAGRGRSGRSWVTAPGTALTASVLLRPQVAPERLGWVTLVAGLAVQRACARLTGAPTGLKWPNDVLALDVGPEVEGWGQDRKVAGILAELVTFEAGAAVVLGVGVNVTQTPEQLPVPWATSLALMQSGTPGGISSASDAPDPDRALTAVGQELAPLLRRWEEGDPALPAEVAAVCVTLGRAVEIDRPGAPAVVGHAVELAPDGRLVVRLTGGETASVLAGDVRHVRKGPTGPV